MASQPENNRAEEIRRTMHEIRRELDDDVYHIKQSASKLTDWQYYIRHYPWACVGAAAAFGFLIVPRKLKVSNPYTEELLKLAKKKRLVINKEAEDADDDAKTGVVRTAFTFLSGLAMRAAAAQVARHLTSILSQEQRGSGVSGATAYDTGSTSSNSYENQLDRRF
ncbi:hypothetical protein [Gimesia algae]|uniref:DUF3618 domain-containing protein n=1 Tax=Gimesia algae TaxID=2527971 RepID=A0A517VB64_9PLAN|nr:hypothetical protein [Gimesia algae]QDT90236.1 hypothetical protein Pan161_18860 [Gimesia algae]